MRKKTIELERDKNWKLGWGKMFDYNWTEDKVLARIAKWTKGKNVRIYRHFTRVEHIFPDGTVYKPLIPGIVGGNEEICDRVRFLDIYYQEKL